VIVATVVIMTALSVMFMVSGQAGDFGDWTQDREKDASCSLFQTQYENACSQGNTHKQEEKLTEAQSNSCDWAETTSGC
jgi:hypothetical protein